MLIFFQAKLLSLINQINVSLSRLREVNEAEQLPFALKKKTNNKHRTKENSNKVCCRVGNLQN